MKNLIWIVICVLKFSTISSQTLISYYPLNGNTNDFVSANNGILHGCSWTADSSNNLNSALQLNGSSDWVEFFSSPIINNQSFSISAWIKINNQTDHNPIIDFGYNGLLNPNEVSFGTYAYNNSISALYTGNYYINHSNLKRIEQYPFFPLTNNLNIDTSKWFHIVLVYDNINSPWINISQLDSLDENFKFFINGIKVQNPNVYHNNPYNPNIVFPINNSMAFGISRGEGNTHYFSGIIDEIKIYSGALDSMQILQIYHNSYSNLNEINKDITIEIYPNPSTDILNIKTNFNFDFLEILDANGKLLINSKQQKQIDISFLQHGVYLILYKNKNKDVVFKSKFIKK